MPTKISALTGYDGDTLDGSETLPMVEDDEGKTEGITVSQLFGNAPADSLAGDALPSVAVDADGHLTHQPSTDDTAAFAAQNAAGQNLLETDTSGGKVVIRQPGGGSSDEVRIYNNGSRNYFEAQDNSQNIHLRAAGGNWGVIITSGSVKPLNDNNLNLGSSGTRWNNFYIEGNVYDGNNNELLGLTSNASASNYIDIANAASGNNPTIAAKGGDTDIGVRIIPKGTGNINFGSETSLNFGESDNRSFSLAQTSSTVNLGADNGRRLSLFSGSFTEAARFDTNQNFLLGKTSHAADLAEIAGTVRAEGGTRSASPTVSDDSIATITPDRLQVLVYVSDGSDEQALVRIDLDNADATAIDSTANVETRTGDLGGTTGTDNKLTIAADNTQNHIDIENRLGGSRDLTVLIIG